MKWHEGMTLQDIADAGLLKPYPHLPVRAKCTNCYHYADNKSLFHDFCKCVCHGEDKDEPIYQTSL